jgi:hypothetical protein
MVGEPVAELVNLSRKKCAKENTIEQNSMVLI